MNKTVLADTIYQLFANVPTFSLTDAYGQITGKPHETVRARIYENLGIKFERLTKGVYKTLGSNEACIVMEGDGRDLSMIPDSSIDCILTDHPWLDMKSNKGGSRSFSDYDCFRYTLDDFREKARVLKQGCFLVEILPSENENNYEYLFQIKQYAKECGLRYYSKVAWKKGTFVSNTGRKSKNTQDVMIFSKGKARSMRLDKKASSNMGATRFMSGCNGMLPTMFDVQPVSKPERRHQSELPTSLCEQIIEFVTYTGETILDTFAGSGVVGEAALNTHRNCLLIELLHENIEIIKDRLGNRIGFLAVDEA